MKKYNKLVRDKIPTVIRKTGGKFRIRTANKREYLVKLKEKLSEEVKEFNKKPSAEEMADILEVIDALKSTLRINTKKLISVKRAKTKLRGAFKKRIILIES